MYFTSDVPPPGGGDVRVSGVLALSVLPFGHPDSQWLVAEVQQEYVRRYGGQDQTPTVPADFAPPRGLFLVGHLDGSPAGCGGWRAHDGDEPDFTDGDAEVKRVYVVPAARGRGIARALLTELERTAAAAGRRRMVLQTGVRQPEAIGLYTSCGYVPVPKFGRYRSASGCRCFGKLLPSPLTVPPPAR